jgi:hypothetical protein
VDRSFKVEIIDCRQQQSRLANNLTCSLAISAIGGPQILAFDDLGEAYDRVERSLDLVDKLTKRIRICEKIGHRLEARRLRWGRVTQRYAAIAGKAPVGRLERRNTADFPLTRDRSAACDPKESIAEWSPDCESSDYLLVNPVAVTLNRLGD